MCLKSNVQHNSMAKSSSIEGVPLTKLSSKSSNPNGHGQIGVQKKIQPQLRECISLKQLSQISNTNGYSRKEFNLN